MKLLHDPERVAVILEPDELGGTWVAAVQWRGTRWRTQRTMAIWTYWGDWWLDADLKGEQRTHHLLATNRGEISLYHRQHREAELCGWFLEGWFD
jgi:hypothetical protein